MKKVLSLLLVFVFLKAQALALSGGPVFAGVQASYVGTYSGVLIPVSTSFTTTSVSSGSSSASIGLFTLGQPDTGVAVGAVLLFIDGAPFNGTLTGIIDPDSATLNAVIDGTSTFAVTILVPTITTVNGVPQTTFVAQNFTVSASGSLEATVSIQAGVFSTGSTAVTPSRIVGTASVDIYFQINSDGTPDVSKTATFDVEGFKQSDISSAASSIGTTVGA